MKNIILPAFYIICFVTQIFCAVPDGLEFRGGHSIKPVDTVITDIGSSIAISDLLFNWSPYLKNITYNALVFTKCITYDQSAFSFNGYLGGVRFSDGKYSSIDFNEGKIDARILFTQNYNNYNARIECVFQKPGKYYIVSCTKGQNKDSEYNEKYSFWVVIVNDAEKNNISAVEDQLNSSIKSKANQEEKPELKLVSVSPKIEMSENTKNEKDWNLKMDINAGFESRYFWRGQDLSKAPVIEPGISLSYGPISVSINSVYALAEKISIGSSLTEFNRIDFGLYYCFPTFLGKIKVGFTDYYMPYLGIKFLKFDDDGKGSHIPEVNLSVTDLFALPLQISGGVNCYNDLDKSWYIEAQYSKNIGNYKLNIFAGGTKGPSKWYNTKTWAVINSGFSVEKSVIISEMISIPVSVGYYLNTYSEESCMVFRVYF